MAFKIKDEMQRSRLRDAIRYSEKVKSPFMRERRQLIDAYVGSNYGDVNKGTPEIIANMMRQTAQVYMVALTGGRIEFYIETDILSMLSFAATFEFALNKLVKTIVLYQSVRECVLDAFFHGGIAKTYLADSGEVEIVDDVRLDPGRPFVKRVSPNDFFHDTNAKDMYSVKFCGDCDRVPFDSLSDPLYDQKVVAKMSPTSKYDKFSDADREDRTDEMAHFRCDRDEYEEMVDLRHVYLPRERKMLCYDQDMQYDPLYVQDWREGPKLGPYDILSFGTVPDNTMPSSPASNLKSLHKLANSLLRKGARQASRQKTNFVFRPGMEEEAQRYRDAPDGGFVSSQNPDNVKVVSWPGADPQTVAFSAGVIDMFDRFAGNLKAAAGLGPQSGTASQDSLIYQQVSDQESFLVERTNEFVAGIGEKLGHLLWYSETESFRGEVEVPGAGVSVTQEWRPGEESRKGFFEDYTFNTNPYALRYRSPETIARSVLQLVQTVFIPLQPFIQQMGGTIDVQELTNIMAHHLALPDLKRIIKFGDIPGQVNPASTGEGGEPPRKSPASQREYVRRNVSAGPTAENKTYQMQLAAMGSDNSGPQVGVQ